MKKLETLYKQNLSRMKTTLESKLEKTSSALEEQKQERRRRISGYRVYILIHLKNTYHFSNQEHLEQKRDKALVLKQELEDGLERWSKQVLEVQENNMRRAEDQVEENKELRRQRSREERRSRERRVMERRKDSKEREDADMKLKRIAIDKKDKKVKLKLEI